MDLQLLVVLLACGGAAIALYCALKVMYLLGWLFARSVSWHRWCLKINGKGSVRRWWRDGESKRQKLRAVLKSLFVMIPELVDCSEYRRGLSTWRGIGDWEVK